MTGQNTVSAQGDTLFAADLRYNSGLVHPGSVPLYAGNISEWQWQNSDGRTHTYSFSYDASGRLTGSALFSDGNADGSFTEGGIIYDRNGNIIGLTRTNGEDEFAKGFAYQGNMLKSLCGKDEISGEYLYDGSGNMTHDGHNGLDLEYNRINLMQKVTRNGAAIADYRYLYNGTKLNAMDSRGEGLEYHGPFTYRIGKDGSVSLSEARFAGGRFVRICDAEGDAMEPVYTFTDHLGSVRAQASSCGNLMEHDNYLPFGTRWNDGSPTDPDNRYRFNGKEEQSFAGLPYIDYGARMYDPCTARWISQDPLAEKYCFISPYAFCNNNPVNIIDPNGEAWYFSGTSGMFISNIDDGDDKIYIINAEQEKKFNSENADLGQFKNTDADGNVFGQMLMEGSVDMDFVLGVLGYFLDMANSTEENSGEKYLSEGLNITLTDGQDSQAEVKPASRTLSVNPQGGFYNGYDVINVFSHEIKHVMDYDAKIPGANKATPAGEIRADEFSIKHWSFKKASSYRKKMVSQHMKQEQSKIRK